jgi:hypothetical protein
MRLECGVFGLKYADGAVLGAEEAIAFAGGPWAR